ncbi:hypothetical protein F8M41_011399 [Gigaspora margarita]|uniref:Uncharacterized protein n=1 Tax=Gigaspora margarita TaxID=4874 RepID=A0A8H3WZ72_GIGMA|nr:hypothetical protein F8M41_011399 [Gigaspora margarita]
MEQYQWSRSPLIPLDKCANPAFQVYLNLIRDSSEPGLVCGSLEHNSCEPESGSSESGLVCGSLEYNYVLMFAYVFAFINIRNIISITFPQIPIATKTLPLRIEFNVKCQ